MAKLSFNNYQQTVDSTSDKSGVGFFTLKNDGDEAIVRIMHSSTDDFDICTVHPIETPADRIKFRNVNCLRGASDPIDNCPFCAAGIPLANKFYIHLVQYSIDESGKMVARPMIWERSMSYVYTIKSLIDEYGPLPSLLFKIKRSGAPGSRDTKYNILFASPQVYPAERYPLLDNPFANYSVVGHGIMNKTPQDMIFFIQSGSFPVTATPKTEAAVSAPSTPAFSQSVPPTQTYVPPVAQSPAAPAQQVYTPASAPAYVPPVSPIPSQPTYVAPQQVPATAAFQPTPTTFTPGTGAKMPWEDNGAAPVAPVKPARYY